jgi:hypothetical protein
MENVPELYTQLAVYDFSFNGLPVTTGDVLCMTDGEDGSARGALWGALSSVVPGSIDHCIVYVGPEGRCVESGAGGVIVYDMPSTWDAKKLSLKRHLFDRIHGVAYPLANRNLSPEQEASTRIAVAQYCLDQARARKPYSFRFRQINREDAFYCSQLVYVAYRKQGIDLSKFEGRGVLSRMSGVVFPATIWNSCVHKRLGEGSQS